MGTNTSIDFSYGNEIRAVSKSGQHFANYTVHTVPKKLQRLFNTLHTLIEAKD